MLVKYPWPGNIRELQNVIERAAILTTGSVLKVPSEGLRAPNTAAPKQRAVSTTSNRDMRSVLEDAERGQIMVALEQAKWIIAGPGGAATLLGMKRSTLQSRMQKLGIRISRIGA